MSAAPVLPSVFAAALPGSLTEAVIRRPVETLAYYRKHTESLLRQYMQKSLELGKTPSILGNCIFRGKVSSRRLRNFEDTVIFVCDIEKCLKSLDNFSQDVIGRVALQEYSQGETATLTGRSLRSIARTYGQALDQLTELFLDYDLLNLGLTNCCQGAKSD
jgi:hypothetical protein